MVSVLYNMTNDGNNENGISTFSIPRYNTYIVSITVPLRSEPCKINHFCRLFRLFWEHGGNYSNMTPSRCRI